MILCFGPWISFKLCCFSRFLMTFYKHYQQMGESAQDSLWPHPPSLLAKYYWQKNTTEADLKNQGKKAWFKQWYTLYNMLTPASPEIPSNIAWSFVTYFLPKSGVIVMLICSKTNFKILTLKWWDENYLINSKKLRLFILPPYILINGWTVVLTVPYCKSLGTTVRAIQEIKPKVFLDRLQRQGSVLV